MSTGDGQYLTVDEMYLRGGYRYRAGHLRRCRLEGGGPPFELQEIAGVLTVVYPLADLLRWESATGRGPRRPRPVVRLAGADAA